MDKPFVAPMGTRIQIGTRVYISLILHHSWLNTLHYLCDCPRRNWLDHNGSRR
jgi:hypothetical protein